MGCNEILERYKRNVKHGLTWKYFRKFVIPLTLGYITSHIVMYFIPSWIPYFIASGLITLFIIPPIFKQLKELKKRVEELEKKLEYQIP